MESFNDIKTIWQGDVKKHLPQISDIENAILQFSKTMKRKHTIVIAMLCISAATLVVLIGVAPFKMWTTYLGITLFLGVAFYTINLKIRKRNKFSHLETLANNAFLDALENEEDKTCTGKPRKIAGLFITWAIGFAFYIFEFIKGNTQWLIIGYVCLTLLILFMWFVYRPIMRKRYQKQIHQTIEKIQQLKTQVNENE